MHSRHWGENRVTTWSPIAISLTPSPTASTTPAPSWPRTVGAYPDGSDPEAEYMSVWQTPQATSLTSTSPGRGSARSSSWTTSGRANSSNTAARTFTRTAEDTLPSVIDAVIFDLDGVLIDSEKVWAAAREELVRESGGTWDEGAVRAMMGMSSP